MAAMSFSPHSCASFPALGYSINTKHRPLILEEKSDRAPVEQPVPLMQGRMYVKHKALVYV